MTSIDLNTPNGRSTLLGEAMGLQAGQRPFPWQVRLLEMFLSGEMPRSLDVPTGLGKTSVIAIWLVATAAGAAMGRRLVYVVDRRAVVDQATEEAVRLRTWLTHRPDVARLLGLTNLDLPISTLRGQFADNRKWLEDPALPAIIVGTVDMIGSRLLFEGYGTSRKMRPYHAGLLGQDALIALDEAHLVPPFEHLVSDIARRQMTDLGPRDAGPFQTPLRLLSLSATGRAHGGRTLNLDESDRADSVVARRINASKRLFLHEVDPKAHLVDVLVDASWERLTSPDPHRRLVVFVSRRSDAEAIATALTKRATPVKGSDNANSSVDVELLVGARRVRERSQAMDRLRTLGFVAGSDAALQRSAVLVATSAGEVGVDLDADDMVSDLAPWERMVQRLGRVNRRGNGDARIDVYAQPPEDKAAIVRFENQVTVIRRLASRDDGALDASPAGVTQLTSEALHNAELANLIEQASTSQPLFPALERATLDAWAMTSCVEHPGRPEVAPWLRGWDSDDEQTELAWRCQLPVTDERTPSAEELARYVEAAPVHLSEVLQTSTASIIEWLRKRCDAMPDDRELDRHAAGADANPFTGVRHVAALVLNQAGELQRTFALDELRQAVANTRQRERLFRNLTGRTLILHASLGGLSNGLLSPKESGVALAADGLDGWTDAPEGSDEPVIPFRVAASNAPDADPGAGWYVREAIPLAQTQEGETTRWLMIYRWRVESATEDDRSTGPAQLLEEHQYWTSERMRHIAERLALPDALQQLLILAAMLHDEGKRAKNWQRAFCAPPDGIYAKTRGPIRAELLNGYRHEFGSLGVAERDPRVAQLPSDRRDLVLHLISAHHGFTRPFVRTSGCEDAPPSALRQRALDAAERYFRLQDRWGPWGLAWLETLLRAADQQASRLNAMQHTGAVS